MPLDRMPMGMLEYTVNFFNADSLAKVHTCMYRLYILYVLQIPECPRDYRVWLQTMYNLFGCKWRRLHCGPMWSIVQDTEANKVERNPSEVSLC